MSQLKTVYKGHSCNHGVTFLAKNVETHEMEYMQLKAPDMYLCTLQ